MKISAFKSPNQSQLKQVILYIKNRTNSAIGNFITGPQISYLERKILKRFHQNPRVTLYIVEKDNIVIDFVFLVFLEWDSNIFGFKIGRLENLIDVNSPDRYNFLSSIIEECRKDGYKHINCRIGLRDFGNLHLLEKLDFNIMDVQITLCTQDNFDTPSSIFQDFIIRKVEHGDLGQLKQIVGNCFTDTRFVIDSRYPEHKVNELYFQWLKNSLLDSTQTVFLVEQKNIKHLIGFCICNFDPDSKDTMGIKIGSIDLIAIAKEHRNKGIGQMFVKFILNWFKNNVDKVEVRTQVSNLAAINAFTKSGFCQFSSGVMLPAGISMHRWL